MKKILDLLTVYLAISILGIFFYENINDVAYGQYQFIAYSLPIITILTVLLSNFFFYRKDFLNVKWYRKCKREYYLYWISLIPYLLLILYSSFQGVQKLKIDSFGFIVFVICIGLLEEFVFRRVTFIELKKRYGVMKGILGSSLIFAIFHAISFATNDKPLIQMPLAVILPFFTGIMYACIYLYTKNIGFSALKRGFLNYSVFFGIDWQLPLFAAVFLFESILCILMLIKSEDSFAKNVNILCKNSSLKKYFMNS